MNVVITERVGAHSVRPHARKFKDRKSLTYEKQRIEVHSLLRYNMSLKPRRAFLLDAAKETKAAKVQRPRGNRWHLRLMQTFFDCTAIDC